MAEINTLSNQPLYQIRDLKHCYDQKVVLDIDSLKIEAGIILGLTGPNGSGKSTLLKLLGFTAKPTRGKILFKGRVAEPFSNQVRFRVTLLPQDPYLMKRSVYRNIAYGLCLHGKRDNLKESVHEALKRVGLAFKEFSKRQWNELSGGEAQRVALAARLALRPEVLLLDEPTANVDSQSSILIKHAALEFRKEYGTTLIVSSHDHEWLDEMCDHVVCLFKGRISGKNRDNIVFGPFYDSDKSYCKKVLADGQLLVIPSSAEYPAVARIDPDTIIITPVNRLPSTSHPFITGIITRLNISGSKKGVIISLRVGDLNLAARLDSKQIERQHLYPGRPVCIEIPERAVSWVKL
jgi:tungstate transport system ATP-binding protein